MRGAPERGVVTWYSRSSPEPNVSGADPIRGSYADSAPAASMIPPVFSFQRSVPLGLIA